MARMLAQSANAVSAFIIRDRCFNMARAT
jgi:hypothetical protein